MPARVKERRTESLQISLTPKEKAYLNRYAVRSHRSWSSLGRVIVISWLQERIMEENHKKHGEPNIAAGNTGLGDPATG